MAQSLDREICPCCGQTINPRIVGIGLQHIIPLLRVYVWAKENNRQRFARKEIAKFLKSETEVANFAYLKWKGGLLYEPIQAKAGEYGINFERCEKFFKNELEIPSELIVYPQKPDEPRRIEVNKVSYFKDMKGIGKWLNANGEFVVQYLPWFSQGTMF